MDKMTNKTFKFIQKHTNKIVIILSITMGIFIVVAFLPMVINQAEHSAALKEGIRIRSEIIEAYHIKDELTNKLVERKQLLLDAQEYELSMLRTKLDNIQLKLDQCKGDQQ